MSELRNYELTLIFVPQDQPDVEKAQQEFETSLKKREVAVTRKEDWGMRRLFHEKDHHRKGIFSFYQFKAQPAQLKAINNDLNVNPGVLKSMIAKM